MSDIFSDLESFGLDKFSEIDIYGDKKENEGLKEGASVNKAPVVNEKDLIFNKTYNCVVCGANFKAKMVRAGKARNLGHDDDLRPRYEKIDVIKYEVVMCPYCGYAALMKNFQDITPTMRMLIRDNISSNFKHRDFTGDIYTYDEAIERYKIALLNSIIKRSKVSERAYTCLKLAWLYRGKAENLSIDTHNYEEELDECRRNEDEFTKKAYEGFTQALANELFPICGMDEPTLSYIMGVLARKCKDYNNSMRLFGSIILSRSAGSNLKESAREQKQILVREMKNDLNQ